MMHHIPLSQPYRHPTLGTHVGGGDSDRFRGEGDVRRGKGADLHACMHQTHAHDSACSQSSIVIMQHTRITCIHNCPIRALYIHICIQHQHGSSIMMKYSMPHQREGCVCACVCACACACASAWTWIYTHVSTAACPCNGSMCMTSIMIMIKHVIRHVTVHVHIFRCQHHVTCIMNRYQHACHMHLPVFCTTLPSSLYVGLCPTVVTRLLYSCAYRIICVTRDVRMSMSMRCVTEGIMSMRGEEGGHPRAGEGEARCVGACVCVCVMNMCMC